MSEPIQERVLAFVQATGAVLSLDIGSGTQDAVLALPDIQPANWPHFVLPSPARMVAERLARLTEKKAGVWLHGVNMGGGFGGAVRRHVQAGWPVTATRAASAALHDDPQRVEAMGVRLAETCPEDCVPVALADYDAAFWERLWQLTELPRPVLVVAAAQDHGCHPVSAGGNRQGRFAMWRELLRHEPRPERWLLTTPPASLTRLSALALSTGGPVADTGTAAVLGALTAPEVAARSYRQGITVVNVGNSHVVAFLVYKGAVLGVYEHHTGLRDTAALLHDLKEFRLGWLPDEVVRSEGGHGTAFCDPLPEEAEGFAPTFVVGPQRELLRGHGQFIAPYGDMMTAGCHGLLTGAALASASA